ncbi:MAG: hypothetical protein IIW91_07140 [Alistipes sp.]|nr:hypothetical protein [Alistipes sp.]
MRTITTTNYKMQYPNATHFAFVPAVIHLTDVAAYKQATVVVQSTTSARSYTETRDVFNGAVYFDVQRAIQMCFDDNTRTEIDYLAKFTDNPLKHTVRVSVTLINDTGNMAIDDFLIDALWGYIRVGESSGGDMRRRWFVNYPFTVDVFTKYGDEFDITVNDGKSDGVIFYNQEPDAIGATPYRRALLTPAQIFDIAPDSEKIHIALPHGIVLKNDNESIGLTAYTLVIDRSEFSTKAVYLRWVDNQGRYCYYLFKKVVEAYEYNDEEWLRNEQGIPTAYTNGLNVASGVRQSFTEGRGMTLGAHLVDEQTLTFLLTLNGSPIVDMFAGYDEEFMPLWQRVNVAAAKYERTTKALQDFNVQVVIPTVKLQSL